MKFSPEAVEATANAYDAAAMERETNGVGVFDHDDQAAFMTKALEAFLDHEWSWGRALMPRVPPFAVIKYVAEELDHVSYNDVEQVANKLFEALHCMPVKR